MFYIFRLPTIYLKIVFSDCLRVDIHRLSTSLLRKQFHILYIKVLRSYIISFIQYNVVILGSRSHDFDNQTPTSYWVCRFHYSLALKPKTITIPNRHYRPPTLRSLLVSFPQSIHCRPRCGSSNNIPSEIGNRETRA